MKWSPSRKAAGLTQEELGDAINASNVIISRTEREEIQPFTSLRYRIHEWNERQGKSPEIESSNPDWSPIYISSIRSVELF